MVKVVKNGLYAVRLISVQELNSTFDFWLMHRGFWQNHLGWLIIIQPPLLGRQKCHIPPVIHQVFCLFILVHNLL